jgi:hypothetical protein
MSGTTAVAMLMTALLLVALVSWSVLAAATIQLRRLRPKGLSAVPLIGNDPSISTPELLKWRTRFLCSFLIFVASVLVGASIVHFASKM